MLKLEQVKRRPEESEDCLREKAASLLRIPPEEILSLTVLRRAVDARPPICLVYTLAVEVKNEGAVLRRSRCRQAARRGCLRPCYWPGRGFGPSS